MTSRPAVAQSTLGTAEDWTVRIHHEVLVKLSNAVLPSSTATTPTAPGGGPPGGQAGERVDEAERRRPSRYHGESRATVVE